MTDREAAILLIVSKLQKATLSQLQKAAQILEFDSETIIPETRRLYEECGRIPAVKYLREQKGLSLKDAIKEMNALATQGKWHDVYEKM